MPEMGTNYCNLANKLLNNPIVLIYWLVVISCTLNGGMGRERD